MSATEKTSSLAVHHDAAAAKLAELAEQRKVPGIAVGILLDGDEDYFFRGVTSIENPLEVDSKTLFQIGSTTKTYTGTVLSILAEQGKVDFSAPVRTYVPELRLKDASVAERVTLLQLTNHTAGWVGDIFTDTGDGDEALAHYVELLAEVDQVQPPGTRASYNNAAVNLAGRVIEKVTGKSYEAAVQELLLDPIGLEESFYFAGDVMTRRFAVGHREHDEVVEVARPYRLPRAANPAGGIVATAHDQLVYARFHLGDGTGKDGVRVIGTEALQRMQVPTVELAGGALGDHVGISWLIEDISGVRTVGHGGATNGQQSAFHLVPERNFAITSLTNSDSGGLLNKDFVDWALETYLGVKAVEDEPLVLEAAELESYAGRYDSGIATVDVTMEGDHLLAKVGYTEEGIRQVKLALGIDPPEQPPVPIKILPRDRFIVVEGEAKGMKGAIARDESGGVHALDFGGRLVFKQG